MTKLNTTAPQPHQKPGYWEQFTEDHPIAAGALILTAIAASGGLLALVAPALRAFQPPSDNLPTMASFPDSLAQKSLPLVHTLEEPSSFLERVGGAVADLFKSPPPPEVAFTSIAPARRVPTAFSPSLDPVDFPQIGNATLPELRENTNYRHQFTNGHFQHPSYFTIRVSGLPEGLTFEEQSLTVKGRVGLENLPTELPWVQLMAREAGANPRMTTRLIPFPVEGVNTPPGTLFYTMQGGRELVAIPITREVIGAEFDTFDVEPHQFFPYPEEWLDRDPEQPDTLRLYPPEHSTPTTEYAFIVKAYNGNIQVGEFTVFSTVSSHANAQPLITKPYSGWQPLQSELRRRHLPFEGHVAPLANRTVAQIVYQIEPKKSKNYVDWILEDSCPAVKGHFKGIAPTSQNSAIVTYYFVDNTGHRSEPEQFGVKPKRLKDEQLLALPIVFGTLGGGIFIFFCLPVTVKALDRVSCPSWNIKVTCPPCPITCSGAAKKATMCFYQTIFFCWPQSAIPPTAYRRLGINTALEDAD